jgi:hypothetical protein
MGVTNPEKGPGTFFEAEPGEDFLDCIRRQTPWLDPRKTEPDILGCTPGAGKETSNSIDDFCTRAIEVRQV